MVKTRKSRGRIRPVAGKTDILAAARSIGLRMGWKAVTNRVIAQQLGYAAPLLYEHFQDKEEILTELAIEGQLSLAKDLATDLPADAHGAILAVVETLLVLHAQGQTALPLDEWNGRRAHRPGKGHHHR
jgi:AcrR family transcriptional regulator